MDVHVKRLVDVLRTENLIDRTVIIVTADEGESLGEHGEETHGLFLYDSTLKVPMIVRYPPFVAPGTKFEGLISGVDVAPTALTLMGVPALSDAQGEAAPRALPDGIRPSATRSTPNRSYGQRAYGWGALRALRSPLEKFIDGPEPELYDLHRDPAETINRAPGETKVAHGDLAAVDGRGPPRDRRHSLGAAGGTVTSRRPRRRRGSQPLPAGRDHDRVGTPRRGDTAASTGAREIPGIPRSSRCSRRCAARPRRRQAASRAPSRASSTVGTPSS